MTPAACLQETRCPSTTPVNASERKGGQRGIVRLAPQRRLELRRVLAGNTAAYHGDQTDCMARHKPLDQKSDTFSIDPLTAHAKRSAVGQRQAGLVGLRAARVGLDRHRRGAWEPLATLACTSQCTPLSTARPGEAGQSIGLAQR